MAIHFNHSAASILVRESSPALRFVLWAIAVVLFAFAVKGSGAEAIRLSGGLLELLGLTTVAVEIAQLRSKFRLPGLGGTTARFLAMIRAVFSPRGHTLAAATGHISVGATASGRARVGLAPGAPLHRRITLLEKQAEQLEDMLISVQRDLATEVRKTQDNLTKGLAEQQIANLETAERVRDIAVGASALQIVGWLWLLLGVVAGTFAEELASVLGLSA